MDDQSEVKQVRSFARWLYKARIQHIKMQRLQDSIKECSQVVMKQPLLCAILLHHEQALLKLLQTAETSGVVPKKHPNVLQFLSTIYCNSKACFLSKMPQYSSVLKELIAQKWIVEGQAKQTSKQVEGISRLLEHLHEIESESQPYTRRININKFISQQLLLEKNQARTALEEVAYNYIKARTEACQAQRMENVCCRVHFQHKSQTKDTKFSEASNHEFKDYYWPLSKEEIVFHLTKTVIGYLNTTGGIVYVGLKESKDKFMEVKGIRLSDKQRLEFLRFLQQKILSPVLPKEQDEGDLSERPNVDHNKYSLNGIDKDCSEFRVSKYVFVDFLNVYNPDTFEDARDQTGKDKLYIVRIKVKKGHPRQLYHLISRDGQLSTFMREDTSVKKKNMNEFYDLFYKRIAGEEVVTVNKNLVQHPNCRFNPEYVET